MLASISATFGLSIDESFLSTIVGSMVVEQVEHLQDAHCIRLLKLIPGIGSIAGGVIAANHGSSTHYSIW